MDHTGDFVGHARQLRASPRHQPTHGMRHQNHLLAIATVLVHQLVDALGQPGRGLFVGVQPVVTTGMHRHAVAATRHQLVRKYRRQLAGEVGAQSRHGDGDFRF
ncbi:hypothetical protein D3C71_1446010 [compost metagenome]